MWIRALNFDGDAADDKYLILRYKSYIIKAILP
ncbi:hypothetical protein ACJIZ3_016649 [Penstemon smallii]|uniref:Uncharacterized protein n=1 Tax=Penstemon smallii TaxID=265156 RepID=A0ABD3STG5_9LAMI